jgi:hypothetical protein
MAMGQTTTSREAEIDVGGQPNPAAECRSSFLRALERDPRDATSTAMSKHSAGDSMRTKAGRSCRPWRGATSGCCRSAVSKASMPSGGRGIGQRARPSGIDETTSEANATLLRNGRGAIRAGALWDAIWTLYRPSRSVGELPSNRGESSANLLSKPLSPRPLGYDAASGARMDASAAARRKRKAATSRAARAKSLAFRRGRVTYSSSI